MLDRDIIIQYHQQDIGYLGPLPSLKEYEGVLMSVSTAELKRHPLKYRPSRHKEDEPAVYHGILSSVSISEQKAKSTKLKDTKVKDTVEARVLILYSTNKAKLDADKRTTLLNRYLERLGAIQKRLNVRRYKKKAYTLERSLQIGKAQRKYTSIQKLVDMQLTENTDPHKTSTTTQMPPLRCC